MFYTLQLVTELLDKIAVPPVPSYKSNKKILCKNNFKKFYLWKEIEKLFQKNLLKSIYSQMDFLNNN